MRDRGRELTELSWLELVHVFAELLGADVSTTYSAGYDCRIDYVYTTSEGVSCCTGLSKPAGTAEESAEHLLREVFKYMADLNFPGLQLPKLNFDTKEDLAVKLAAAGVDPEFSLTHGSG